MSAFEERDFPGYKKFICKLCGADFFTRQGIWQHLEWCEKHTERHIK